MSVLTKTSHSQPPLVGGLPLLGNALALRGDLTAFLVDNYQQHGSAFRIRVLNRDYVILGGLDANRLLSHAGNELFTGERFFGGFAQQFETDNFLPAMEGASHRHLRKLLRPGYSKEAVASNTVQLHTIVTQHVAQWAGQPQVRVVDAIQRLITDQLGIILGGRSLGDYFPYVRDFLRIVVNVTMLGTAPRLMLRTRRYVTARAKTREFLMQLITTHRQQHQGGDLIDLALQGANLDGSAFTDDDLVVIGIGAYVAGMDTLANTLSFLLYALLKHPEAMRTVQAEADALFANGTPALSALRAMPALHHAAIETLRLYLIAPVTMRTTLKDFTFDGYSIRAGTDVMIANCITHFLPEYYPNPKQFDLNRDFTSVPAGVFTPFTLGSHTCLGAGMAESLLMFTAAALLHSARLELTPADYVARIRSTPAPNPGQGFTIRVHPR
ncbi:MAG: cytochrome P450 [Armatimonadetes bacterium]|nr:cytochrome P450 [Anaerolineae bacterium]